MSNLRASLKFIFHLFIHSFIIYIRNFYWASNMLDTVAGNMEMNNI